MNIPKPYLDFWRGPKVSAVQVARFRVAFFVLIAIDAFLMIGHASRYGAGDFNVGHFPALSFTLGRETIIIGALVMCYLAARIAMGCASKWLTPALAVIYSVIYFSSQLDSYQHHYLLALILIALSIGGWTGKSPSGPVVRLILIQVSVVYLFAAISKMEAGWWDGRALEATLAQLEPSFATRAVEAIGTDRAAKLLALSELFLAFAIHFRFTRLPAAIVGIALHIGIELAGFKIQLFSFYMFAIYLLVLPPRAFRWSEVRWRPQLKLPGHFTVHLLLAVGIGIALLAIVPLDGKWIAAAVIACVAIAGSREKHRAALPLAHVVAVVFIVGCAFTTDAIRDHYRFWGGTSKRLGDPQTALHAYERLVDHDPDYSPGRRNLGKLYLAAGRTHEALRQYQDAARTGPREAPTHLGLATVYLALKQNDDASYHAKRAIELAEINSRNEREKRQVIQAARSILRQSGGAL